MPVSMQQQQQSQQQQQQQDEGVVWVHRQCALWSPEVYPDRRSMLVSCCWLLLVDNACVLVYQHAVVLLRVPACW
jgi:hypothetical protein